MDLPNIKPNSIASKKGEEKKPEEKRVERVTSGNVKKKETSDMQKFVKGFLPDDATSVKDYIISESPSLIKKFFRELIQGTLDAFLPDTGRRKSGSSGSSRVATVSYNSFSSLNAPARARLNNSVYDYDNLVFESYTEAQDVLDAMYDCLARYNFVRVLDLYDLAGVPSVHTDGNYGWYDLRGSKIVSIKEGWMISLPQAVPRN